MDLKDEFLLKDFEQWSDSFWKNEQTGEHRLDFLLGLATAVFVALAALAKTDDGFAWKRVEPLALFALPALLLLGLLMLLRVLRRDRVSSAYIGALCAIRDHALRDDKKLLETITGKTKSFRKRKWIRGAIWEIVATLNALLAGGTVFIAVGGLGGSRVATPVLWAVAGGLLAVGLQAVPVLVSRSRS